MADELKGKNILLVDDDPDILDALRSALSDTGANVDTARDGNEALGKASASMPDLMVLDMMMPKRSGFLVLESLKKGKQPDDPPQVVVITGNPGVRHRIYAESLGVQVYMTKPFRMDRLIESIRKLLA